MYVWEGSEKTSEKAKERVVGVKVRVGGRLHLGHLRSLIGHGKKYRFLKDCLFRNVLLNYIGVLEQKYSFEDWEKLKGWMWVKTGEKCAEHS